MNSLSLTTKAPNGRTQDPEQPVPGLEEAWFDEVPPTSTRRSSTPPPVSVGEFLGDPLADSWLR
jgi:hypothetical protein